MDASEEPKSGEHAEHAEEDWDGERIRARLMELVRQEPIVAVAAASAVGVALGGLVFSRLGRLAFAAAVGYVANELWRREGRFDVDDVLHRLMR